MFLEQAIGKSADLVRLARGATWGKIWLVWFDQMVHQSHPDL